MTETQKAAMQAAIDALEDCRHGCEEPYKTASAVMALRADMSVTDLYELWSQARAVHPDDPLRQNAAFMGALGVFAKLVRNAALEEAAQLCDSIWQEDGSAMRCRDEIRSMK